MSYTWGDIKLATLQKMFAADGDQIVQDESTKDYLAGMPYAANEGLIRLATAGKFITKPLTITHIPPKNLIPDYEALKITDAREVTFAAEKGRSLYFQFNGHGTFVTTVGGVEVLTTEVNSNGVFSEHKQIIENATNSPVSITFHSDYPFYVKSIAIYADAYPEDKDIPEYGTYVKYNLRDLASDFYNLGDNAIVYEGGSTPTYLSTTDYYRESDNILVLPANRPGIYTVYYHAYPEKLTNETLDEYVLEIDPDLAVLLPLYMAAALYMDDDLAISTTLRNQFEVGLESLIDTSNYSGKEEFKSEWV